MKTILATCENSFFVRNFLRTDALPRILARGDVRLVLLAPQEKLEYYRKEFPHPRVVFDVLPPVRKRGIERFFNALEKSSIHTRTAYMLLRSDFERSRNVSFLRRGGVFVLRLCAWMFGGFKLWRVLVRSLYSVASSKLFTDLFATYRPDLVFCPYMVFADYALLKEAKKSHIKTLGMTLSWDNLYSKTLLLVHPDHLIVQTDTIKKQAEMMGDYHKKTFSVSGIPQYDRHISKQGIISRGEFMKSIGGDPQKKLMLYAFSGKAGLHIDFEILEMIDGMRKRGALKENIEVLARPYPRTDFPQEKLERVKKEYGILCAPSVAHVGVGAGDWEFDERALSYLVNSLYHADVVITMYSTFFIEAALYDKPLIGVAFDGARPRSYWDSAARFFEWDHLAEIKTLNGIWLVKTANELTLALNTYLKNPHHLSEGRAKIVERQVQYTDGRSAERVADVILSLL